MRTLAAFILFYAILIPAPLMAAEAPAAKAPAASDADPIPNLLEQLDIETAKPAAPPAALSPKLSDPLLNKSKKLSPFKSFDEIPEEVIEEAEQVARDCAADPMLSTYYDCECRAMRFIEVRIMRGPVEDQSTVLLDIRGECPNTPAIAGSAYQTCIQQGISFFPAGQDPEEYCSCVGNSYAKLYARAGQAFDSRLIVQLKTIATLSCTQQPPGVPVLVPPIK
jgi:hypothetical protein